MPEADEGPALVPAAPDSIAILRRQVVAEAAPRTAQLALKNNKGKA